MDIFNEQLVLRKKSPVESAFKYGVFACAALLISALGYLRLKARKQ